MSVIEFAEKTAERGDTPERIRRRQPTGYLVLDGLSGRSQSADAGAVHVPVTEGGRSMTDYGELVRKMRTCIGYKKCFIKECRYWSEFGCMDGNMCCDAAAAIEALQALLTEADKKQTYQHDCICELTAENEELQAEVEKWTFNATLEQSKAIANFESYCKLKAQLPKRGEWEPYDPKNCLYTCSACRSVLRGKTGYCPNCGAKMEVQDGQK